MNYDATQVGVPYCRVSRIFINYPDNGQAPSLTIEQCLAVRLADGTPRKLENLPSIDVPIDMSKAQEPIPLIMPETDSPIPDKFTNLQQVYMCVLAFVRAAQHADEAAKAA
ncbi:MAG: hypothetical protein KGL39_16755 [Patescibacteria group bacterium]|nr:hypothetical protein [Patescibacteria group bacterium]